MINFWKILLLVQRESQATTLQKNILASHITNLRRKSRWISHNSLAGSKAISLPCKSVKAVKTLND